MRRSLAVALVVVAVGCASGVDQAGDTVSGPDAVETDAHLDGVGDWLAAVILDQPGGWSWDLFFGAFYVGDNVFFGDPEGAACFTDALVAELAAAGPSGVIEAMEDWALAGKSAESSWNDVIELFNSVSYEERVAIGRAASQAIERCGGLHDRLLSMYDGPSLASCMVEFAARYDVTAEMIAGSLEMNSNARAEWGPESEAFFATLPAETDTAFVECLEQFTQVGKPEDEAASEGQTEVLVGEAAAGKTVFEGTCAACHGEAAEGIAGLGLGLVGTEFVTSLSADGFAVFMNQGRPANHPDNTTGVDCPPLGGNPTLTQADLSSLFAYLQSVS